MKLMNFGERKKFFSYTPKSINERSSDWVKIVSANYDVWSKDYCVYCYQLFD